MDAARKTQRCPGTELAPPCYCDIAISCDQPRPPRRATWRAAPSAETRHRRDAPSPRRATAATRHRRDAPEKQLARKLGVHNETVLRKRAALGIPSHRPHRGVTSAQAWTAAEDRLRGTIPDAELTARLWCTAVMVGNRRKRLGVAALTSGGQVP